MAQQMNEQVDRRKEEAQRWRQLKRRLDRALRASDAQQLNVVAADIFKAIRSER